MPFASALSNLPSLADAVAESTAQIQAQLRGVAPDLTCVFVSHHHAAQFQELPDLLNSALPSRVRIGCTGESIVGRQRECEDQPALSVWAATMPDDALCPFHLTFEETPDGILCSGPETLSDSTNPTRVALALGDPYSTSPRSLLDRIHEELPGVPVVGGMASGGGPGENRLFLQDQVLDSGAVGVVVAGPTRVQTVVSQGCRPIGTPFVITRAERNVIHELGGVSPLERLQTLYPDLPPRDQKLVESGVHLGVVMNEYQDHFARGDFLIVNVHGVDRSTGALALGGLVRVGQTVQFHIRDAETADEDLRHLLEGHARSDGGLQGGLLFTCNGRGTRMFPTPHHDATVIEEALGPLPLAGFFAQGELGPVGGKNYIHGFTASLAVFDQT